MDENPTRSLDSVQRLGLGGLEREEWLGPEISVRRCWTVEVFRIVFFYEFPQGKYSDLFIKNIEKVECVIAK